MIPPEELAQARLIMAAMFAYAMVRKDPTALSPDSDVVAMYAVDLADKLIEKGNK